MIVRVKPVTVLQMVILLLQLLQNVHCRSVSDNSDNVTVDYIIDHLLDNHHYDDHYHYDSYDDLLDDDVDYESVYDAIRDELPEVLTQVERRYKTHIQHHYEQHPDHPHPLLSLVSQEPHTMTIMMRPMKKEPRIKVNSS